MTKRIYIQEWRVDIVSVWKTSYKMGGQNIGVVKEEGGEEIKKYGECKSEMYG